MSENTKVDIWIAGACAAFSVDVVVYPLDTLKTRLQSQNYRKLYTDGPPNYKANRALVRGIYQGLGSVIVATLPAAGAFFTTYEGAKSILHQYNPTWKSSSSEPLLPQPIIHAAASGIAELVACAFLNPAEVIKQNAQMVDNSGKDRPKVNATLQTLRRFRSNPLALWRGYTVLASRNLPFTALQFPMFERMKTGIKQYRDEKGIRTNTSLEGAMITVVSAGTAGSIAAVLTTPVDVIKTRIMLTAGENTGEEQKPSANKSTKDTVVETTEKATQQAKENLKSITKSPRRKTSMHIAREVVQEQGVKGLFRGGTIRGLWTMLGAGLYLGGYEGAKTYLAQRRERKREEEE